ncbi:MAG: 23S rRNA (uracil(1939)-C(5))-methyltransferase RlmD [Lachnospiraceae bacterium]|nr:23S rRNA (uracil(1939)-C(5))-methyltransferase RlmD [Lachnospiraceae bacterium]
MTFQKNEEVILDIDDLGNNGEGIGHLHGYTLFVKGALPGEKIKARIMKQKKGYGYARLSEILIPSPDRVEPLCPSAGPCGGCTLQHLSYEGQLKYKEKKVRDCLTRIGGVDMSSVEWLPILGMTETAGDAGQPWRYRNKAQFPVRADKEGKPVTGFFAGRSHSIIPVSSCAIQHPVINEAAECVLAFMQEFKIAPYDEENHKGLVRHIYVRRGYHTGEVMVCLVINGTSLPHSDKLVERLREIEGMTGISLNVNEKRTNVILGSQMILLWGESYIEDTIGDIRYRISPQSFYQVNPLQTKRLYDTVAAFADLKGNEKVWDLYCGIGTISLFLARHAGHVFGVEIVPEAVENARENAARNGIENVTFVCGAAEDVAAEQGVDVIVVDPPRKGCDAALIDTMVKMQPEKIVYVSCDPATLARDVKLLGEQGYEVRKVQACDMFPQGGHVESVCLLSKLKL